VYWRGVAQKYCRRFLRAAVKDGSQILEKARGLLRSSREVSAEREFCRSSWSRSRTAPGCNRDRALSSRDPPNCKRNQTSRVKHYFLRFVTPRSGKSSLRIAGLVGSRTGAVFRRSGLSVAPRFLWECLNSQTVNPFPAPATSHPACGFPALGATCLLRAKSYVTYRLGRLSHLTIE